MRIAVDAMGGDRAPQDIIKGAVMAARENGIGIILVGPQEILNTELANYDTAGLDIEIAHTEEYLLEGEQPAYALRTKRKASIAVATKLVRDGKAAAVFGAGPTGGMVAAALGYLGMVEGISRPVIGGPFCGLAPRTVVMDLGGNMDVRADQLLDFAIVGVVFARKVLKIADPKVALLSVGTEEGKGNEQVKNSYPLFKKSGLNFIGNIEGYDIVSGKANVVVCDGFVGNIILKFYEALVMAESRLLNSLLIGKLAEKEAWEISNAFANAISAGNTGGGPIWAVNGLVVKAHGSSKAEEIAKSIAQAKQYIDLDMVNTLKTELLAIRKNLQRPGA